MWKTIYAKCENSAKCEKSTLKFSVDLIKFSVKFNVKKESPLYVKKYLR